MTQLDRSSYRGVGRLVGGVGLASLALIVFASLSARRDQSGRRGGARRTLGSPRLIAHPGSDGHLGATEPGYDWAHAGRS